jgi:hypothetical protein
LQVSSGVNVQIVCVADGHVHAGSEKETVVTSPRDLERQEPDPTRRAHPEVRKPKDGHAADAHDWIREHQIRRRDASRAEADGRGRIHARTESDVSVPVDLHAAGSLLDSKAISPHAVPIEGDENVSPELEARQLGIELEAIGAEPHIVRTCDGCLRETRRRGEQLNRTGAHRS